MQTQKHKKRRFSPHLMGAQHRKLESGQAIVLIAMALVGLIAIMGLAVDGGGLLLLRRDAQNTVDAAIQAATFAQCSGGDVVHAGAVAAAANGYDDVDGVNFTDMSDAEAVQINNPPQSGPLTGDINYIEIIVTAEKPKYFIGIVYEGDLIVTARGVGRCKVKTNPYNQALTAMAADSNGCPFPMNVTANSVTIEGGMMSAGNIALQPGGAGGDITGDVAYGGDTFNYNGNATFNPAAPTGPSTEIPEFPPLFKLETFAPGGDVANYLDGLTPDQYFYYTDADLGGNGSITLPKDRIDGLTKDDPLYGVYFVPGDVKLNQALTESGAVTDPFYPQFLGLTIIATGDISVSSNISGQKFEYNRALASIITYNLMFFSGTNDGGCNSSGGIATQGSTNYYEGIFYAPGSNISFAGSDNQLCGAMIGMSVNPAGADQIFQLCDVFPPYPPEIVYAE